MTPRVPKTKKAGTEPTFLPLLSGDNNALSQLSEPSETLPRGHVLGTEHTHIVQTLANPRSPDTVRPGSPRSFTPLARRERNDKYACPYRQGTWHGSEKPHLLTSCVDAIPMWRNVASVKLLLRHMAQNTTGGQRLAAHSMIVRPIRRQFAMAMPAIDGAFLGCAVNFFEVPKSLASL